MVSKQLIKIWLAFQIFILKILNNNNNILTLQTALY